ncbi:Lrp/AsnC family transcriptional regulator [Devosia sp.]|uniref:Lrp/AsnC family transcriptional regulator n=1 Tax=Devosia sp. TaxID=1871048 RepID=UPI003267D716
MVDKIDRAILSLLRADGRMSNARLAEAVGLSPSACLRRLHLLEASGVIRGYTAIIEDGAATQSTVVIVQITLDHQTDEHMKRFEAAARKCVEIRECYLMAGLTDYLLRVEAQSIADYERIHSEILSKLPSVTRIQSNFAIRNVIRNFSKS